MQLHEQAAVSEGLCPAHGTALEPAAMRGGEIAGHCTACRKYWWLDPGTSETGWSLDHRPWGPDAGTLWPPMRSLR